ncbi:MAG: thioredoxin domain-containing protein [Myxococcales bacterium]|nr:thioredoxin domain-containing protein [Myxococcales bacterium]
MKTHVMVVASAMLAVAVQPPSVYAETTPEKVEAAETEVKTETPASTTVSAEVPDQPSSPPKSAPAVEKPASVPAEKILVQAAATEAAEPVKNAVSPSAKAASPAAESETDEASPSVPLTDETVVASWVVDGKSQQLTFKALKDARKAAFRRLEQERYNTIQRELEGFILDKLLREEAERNDKTADAYVKSLADAVSEEEIKKFYESTVSKDGKSPPLESVEQRIRQYLAMKDATTRIRKEAKLKLSVPQPNIPPVKFNLSDRPHKGAKDAKLTLVEFSDFQCPYCSKAIAPLNEILKEFPNDVELYFFHFPLSFHKKAKPAAIAARCAQKQGKFWEMHDLIFENQSKLGEEDLKTHATKLELDLTKYETCVKDPEVAKFVDEDMSQGSEAGVGGTPSFFVNGRALERPPTVESIRAML